MLALGLALVAHVPHYTAARDGCFRFEGDPTVSQSFYVEGSGGVEVPLQNQRQPFDQRGGELVDFDAVLRDAVDLSTFALYVGCGGCHKQDALPTAPRDDRAYKPAVLEPFTQTVYRSVLPDERPQFNASALRRCTAGAFTVRVVDYANRTDGRALVWAAVVGKAEAFSALELVRFPLYVLTNHAFWNELGWTKFVALFVAAPLLLLAWRVAYRGCGCFARPGATARGEPRQVAYVAAFLGFTWAAVEQLIHLAYAQARASVDGALAAGLAVALLPNLLGLAVATSGWRGLDTPSLGVWYSLLELGAGVALLFVFGAGFFLGPAGLLLAGLLRCCEQGTGRVVVVPRAPSPGARGPLAGFKMVSVSDLRAYRTIPGA